MMSTLALAASPQVHVDDEEVSLSNSSLGSDDGDSSDEEELEESESIDLTASASFGGGASSSSDSEKDANSDGKSGSQDKRLSLRRHTVAHLSPRLEPNFVDDINRKATKSEQQVSLSLEGIDSTLSAEEFNQHVLLSTACLQLLEERDRFESMRRLNLRRSLNCTNVSKRENNFVDDNEDEEYPLLSLIKSGPLYKLHLKGGTATKKIRSGKDKIKSKLTRSSSADTVGARTTESSLLTTWKHKYVEVRKGMMSYYANTTSSLPTKSELVRKNVTLDVSTCVCRAINLEEGDSSHPFDSDNDTISSSLPPKIGKPKGKLYAFELVVDGESRVWASRSEVGRQSWIKTINRGMIGRSVKDDISGTKSDPKAAQQLQQFLTLSKNRAKNFSKEEREVSAVGQAFSVLWGTSVEVPVGSLFTDKITLDTPQTASKDEQRSLWQNLENLTIAINGKLFRASSMFCPQRVFGFLTRSILEHDRSASLSQKEFSKISEIQAARHARDILRSVGKQDEKIGYLRASVGVLCGDKNDEVIIEDAGEKDPIIKINMITNNVKNSVQPNLNVDRRGWVFVRKKSKQSKRLFAVLSVGVLCLYKEEFPRPHRLKSQLLLVGASIGTREQRGAIETSLHTNEDLSSHSSNLSTPTSPPMKNPNYILYIKGRQDGKWVELQLCFMNYDMYIAWRDALVNAIETSSSPSNVLSFDGVSQDSLDEVQAEPITTTPRNSPDKDGISWITMSTSSTAGDLHVSPSRLSVKRVTSRIFESLPPLPPLQISSPKFRDRKHSYPSSLLSSLPFTKSKQLSRNNSSEMAQPTAEDSSEKLTSVAVNIECQVSKLYTVFSNNAVDPSMCTIRAKYTEMFACFGGKMGRLKRRQEFIKLEVLKGKVNEDAFELAFDSKSLPRRRKSI